MPGNPLPIPLIQTVALERTLAAQQIRLLEPADFCLYDGERVSLTGPSGSGKSVLLRLIALLDQADCGSVLWRGQAISPAAVPSYRRQVAYLPQRAAMFDGTVEQNLRYPFSLATYRQDRFDMNVALQLAARTGRGAEFLKKNGADLSGGEAQIVALIRVLQLSPTVLLLDEPTASLDPNSALEVEALVDSWFAEPPITAALQHRARASIWVSHDPSQVKRIGTRRLNMVRGRLTAEASQ